MKAAVGREFGSGKHVRIAADYLKVFLGTFNHRYQEIVLGGFAKGLSTNNNLVFAINHGNAIVSLNYAV
jgi:hypothetical protein